MRQVFSSLRLENVEAVATLLRDAGIEVRITNGRSYKGKMRSRASARAGARLATPAFHSSTSTSHTPREALLICAGSHRSRRGRSSSTRPSTRLAANPSASATGTSDAPE